MTISLSLASLFMAAAPVQAVEQVDVAYAEMAAGEDNAAIRKIEANVSLERDDSARLINLGIAYARQGNRKAARTAFESVILNHDKQYLETGTGTWVDSRDLARQALAMLDKGDLESTSRFAKR